MPIKDLLAEIDAEIARLEQARSLLAAGESGIRRGRPKNTSDVPASLKPTKKKRNLTPEGRARIAAAVKRRWAAQKAAGKSGRNS
jgi:hypothetical protein